LAIQTSLTPAQKTALKNAINANTTQLTVTYDNGSQISGAINTLPNDGTVANVLAVYYNQTQSPAFYAYYSNVPISIIRNCITWKRLTPSDSPDTTTQWTNRSLACQGAQFNLELMGLLNSATLDFTQANILQGFSDALSSVPSGTGGAAQDAGWSGSTGVKQNACRAGSIAEALFASTSGGTGADTSHAATFVFEGSLNGPEVFDARTNG
jgi:hypothetical protein